jgi:hypothetical protein
MNDTGQWLSASDSVVLDPGALVIHAGPELAGQEIEISLARQPGARRIRDVVHARHNRHGVSHSAVFHDVREGEYVVWRDATPAAVVTVRGGEVTEYHLTH